MSRLAVAMLAFGCVAAGQPALPDEVLHLARARAKVKEAFASLPNFVCLATTYRFVSARGSAEPVLEDIIRMDVAHIGSRDVYAWPERDNFHEFAPAAMIGRGVFGSGSYAAHAQDVFIGGFALIKYAGLENVNGRPARVWHYSVPDYASNWMLRTPTLSATAGSEGSFWANASNDEIERLIVRATGIPDGFPIRSITITIDFASVTIQGRPLWLAQAAEEVLVHADGTSGINRTSFSHCRQYAATTTLSFEGKPAALAGSAPAVATHVQLEPGLRIALDLETEILSDSAAVGDSILARLASDVRRGGRLIAAKGSPVRGRLRQMRRTSDPVDAHEIGLEFTEIELPAGTARFYATLETVDSPVPGLKWLLSKEGEWIKTSSWSRELHSRIAYLSRIPGVGNFFIEGKSFVLPRGMRMTWLTESISAE